MKSLILCIAMRTIIILYAVVGVEAILPGNGSCNLFTFVPFTFGNESFYSFDCGECNNVGMSHAAAALMAIDHFNSRNPSVVAELAQFQDCPVQFENSKIFDTGSYTNLAAETLLSQPEVPCAVAGAFHDQPTLELSTLAAALKFPVTAYRAFSLRALDQTSPYTSQVFPEVITSAYMLTDYLLHIGRTDFVAFLYALTETGIYRRETVQILLDEKGIENQAFAYNSQLRSPATSDQRTIRKALQGIIDSGYRTIVVAAELPIDETPLLAKEAVDLGLTNGDYLWIWFGDYDPFFEDDDPVLREFLAGSMFLTPFQGYHLGEHDPFLRSWRSRGQAEVEELNLAVPDFPGKFQAENDFFVKTLPEWGTSFLYDAVISTGIGACLAWAATNGTEDIPIDPFVEGIRAARFTGASGVVGFCTAPECELDGGRYGNTVIWGVLNNYPPGDYEDEPWILTELFYFPQVSSEFIFPNDTLLFNFFSRPKDMNQAGIFLPINDAVYADGRSVPPDLLRDTPEQNYLSRGVRAVGFTFVGTAMVTAVLAAIWIFVYRSHRFVRAAQPYFLYLICLGAAVSVSAIITISFDESYGWSEEQLSRACMATPWLSSLGHILTYGGLFSKLWRVNRVLQFARRKVDIIHVAWPSALCAAAALVVLSLWTGLDSLTWVRTETNAITGESIGQCKSNEAIAFIIPLVFILIIPTLLTFYMAWKTKDVDDAFSESRWIFMMVLVQLEVLLFALPMIPLLYDVSTDGRYIGYSILIWTFPMSTLCLLIGPKVFAVHRRNNSNEEQTRGGFTGKVKISGLQNGSHQHASSSYCSSDLRHSHNSHYSEGTQAGAEEVTEVPTGL